MSAANKMMEMVHSLFELLGILQKKKVIISNGKMMCPRCKGVAKYEVSVISCSKKMCNRKIRNANGRKKKKYESYQQKTGLCPACKSARPMEANKIVRKCNYCGFETITGP